jgi:hypothetical protein
VLTATGDTEIAGATRKWSTTHTDLNGPPLRSCRRVGIELGLPNDFASVTKNDIAGKGSWTTRFCHERHVLDRDTG